MPARSRSAAGLLAFAVLLGCSDEGPVSSPPSARFTQLDGATTGNPHFYFLRPIAISNPQPSGEFNATLYPTVEICAGPSVDAAGHCTQLLSSFTRDGGVNNAGEVISIPDGEELYKVEWRTGTLNVPSNTVLRVSVLLGDFTAGFTEVVKTSDGFRSSDNTVISGNATLPIKFRIENGVICGDAEGCLETTVGPEGGTQVIDDGSAGATFPEGALDEPVNLIISEVTDGECLPTDLQQFRACYHYSTEPHVENFNVPVTVGICMLDPSGGAYLADGQLRLWKWSEEEGSPLVELERVQIDFLDCPDFSSASVMPDTWWGRGLVRAGRAVFGPLAAIAGPRPLYAAGGYEGGKLSNFSRIGWVRPVRLAIMQGDGQTGSPGSALPIQPTVRLQNRYGSTFSGVSGWSVSFAASGDGSAAPASAPADASGLAGTTWTLSSVTGANTLVAAVATSRPIAPAPYEPSVTFNATGVDRLKVNWQPPLAASSANSGTFASGLQNVVVTISVVGGGDLARLTATETLGQYQANWNMPALDNNKTYRIAVSVNGTEAGALQLLIVNGELRNASTGYKVLNLKNSRTLPIKVVLYR